MAQYFPPVVIDTSAADDIVRRTTQAAEEALSGTVDGLVTTYDTIADLKAATAVPDTKLVQLKGRDAPGDSPARTLIYDAASTATADDATVIQAPALMGRFLDKASGEITWRTFGADKNGVHDSTDAIRAAIWWSIQNGETSKIPAGNYRISGQLVDFEKLRDGAKNITIEGQGEGLTTLNLEGPIPEYLFKIWGPTDAYNGQNQLSNVKLRGFNIRGDGENIQRVFDFRALSYFSIDDVRTFRCRGQNLSLKQCWEGYLDLKMVRGGQCPRLPITGTIAKGQIITGQTSGATAWVAKAEVDYLKITGVTGAFIAGETIIAADTSTAIAGQMAGEEEYVASFGHLFLDGIGKATGSCNNIDLPKGFQIEAAEARALYIGPNCRKITAFGSKFHYDTGYSYNFPALVLDGTNACGFYDLNMSWSGAASIRLERKDMISDPCVDNALMGNYANGGIELFDDCRRNVIVGNSGTTAPGRAAFATVEGGMDNIVHSNGVVGPEVWANGVNRVKAYGGTIRYQMGAEPSGGWSSTAQVHVNGGVPDTVVLVEADQNAYTAFKDRNTTIPARAGGRGNSFIVQVSDADAMMIEESGRISFTTAGGVIRYRAPGGSYYSMGVYDSGQPHFGAAPLGTKVAVPSSPTAPGALGQWAADTSFLYICTNPNAWRRVALETWTP